MAIMIIDILIQNQNISYPLNMTEPNIETMISSACPFFLQATWHHTRIMLQAATQSKQCMNNTSHHVPYD